MVDDSGSERLVALRGESGENSEHGILVFCPSSTNPAAVAFASGPSNSFAVKPGEQGLLALNKTAISLVSVQQNDSTATTAVGEIYDLVGLMEILAQLGDEPAKARITVIEGAELSIPTDGIEKAIAQFREACGV